MQFHFVNNLKHLLIKHAEMFDCCDANTSQPYNNYWLLIFEDTVHYLGEYI